MIRIRDPKNLACAGMFAGIAALLAYDALQLPIGSVSEMGPGYFPLALAIILGGLGALLALQSLRLDGPPVLQFEWRGFLMVTLAVIAFGATISRLGFIPAVVVTVGLAIAASGQLRLRTSAIVVAVLLAFCWIVFVRGLGLPVRLLGG